MSRPVSRRQHEAEPLIALHEDFRDLCAALDDLRGIATRDELERELNRSLDPTATNGQIAWGTVNNVSVAAGDRGTPTLSVWRARIASLDVLVNSLPADPGIKSLRNAAKGTALESISLPRLADLWTAINAGTVDALNDESAEDELPHQLPQFAPFRNVQPVPVDPVIRPAPQPKIELVRSTPPAAPKKRPSALVGKRFRVRLDHEGFRTVALFDPESGVVQITTGDLEGRIFGSPEVAARNVIERLSPGGPAVSSGEDIWFIDDGTNRSIRQLQAARTAAQPTKRAPVAPVNVKPPASSTPSVRPAARKPRTSRAPGTVSTSDIGMIHFVRQVEKRGGKAVPIGIAGSSEVSVSVPGRSRVLVRVETRNGDAWQVTTSRGRHPAGAINPDFWAFVDFGSPRAVYIVPAVDVRLAVTESTGQQEIPLETVEHGEDCWGLLGL